MRISIGLIVFALIMYMVGAKFPQLAQKVGLV